MSDRTPRSDAPPTSPLGEHAADADALFRVFVQHRDVACPRCDYNIRNAQNPTCPECGEPLRLTVGLERPIIGALLATVAPALGCGVCAIIFLILIVIAPGAPRGIVVCSLIMLAAGLGGVALILRRRAFMRLSRERQRMCAVISITAHGFLVGILALVLLNG